jgi:hypothetical protein
MLVTLQSSLPTDLMTSGLQPGCRIISHISKMVAGVGVAPTEVELMKLT